jgi:RNA polymerase sigma factor (TIGR02999 family)
MDARGGIVGIVATDARGGIAVYDGGMMGPRGRLIPRACTSGSRTTTGPPSPGRPGRDDRRWIGYTPDMSDVTRLLAAAHRGDKQAAADLLPLVYAELRQLAAAKLAREKPGQTLDATALVHEAYLRLVGDRAFAGRGHFLAAAAEAMRRILIDNARRKLTEKHGGDRRRIDLDDVEAAAPSRAADLVALDEALTRFAAEDPVKARLVTLRYFAGLSVEEAADALGLSRATATRYWAYARTWLYCELGGPGPEPVSRKNAPPD